MKKMSSLLLIVLIAAGCSSHTAAKSSKSADSSVHFKPSLLFETNEDKIKDSSIVDENSRWLKAHPGKVMILEGHCDERGDREFNLHLGDKRARAVAKAMMARGVPEKQLIIVSYGKDRPFVKTKAPQGWDANRQVHFIVR